MAPAPVPLAADRAQETHHRRGQTPIKVDGPHGLGAQPPDVIDLGDLVRGTHAETGGRSSLQALPSHRAVVDVCVAGRLLAVLLNHPDVRDQSVLPLPDPGLFLKLPESTGGLALPRARASLRGLPPKAPLRTGLLDESPEPLRVTPPLSEAVGVLRQLALVQVARDRLVRPKVVVHPAEVPALDKDQLPHRHLVQDSGELARRREPPVVSVDELGERVCVPPMHEKGLARMSRAFAA